MSRLRHCPWDGPVLLLEWLEYPLVPLAVRISYHHACKSHDTPNSRHPICALGAGCIRIDEQASHGVPLVPCLMLTTNLANF